MKDKELLEKFKMNVAINNLKTELTEEHTLTKENEWRDDMKNIFKIGAAACLMVVSVTGMVFAKEISTTLYENFFHTGDGMKTAINEGYIENPEMQSENSVTNLENEETGQTIEGTDTKIKVDEFVMDDFNLSMTFDVELSEKTQEMITAAEIMKMNFPDLIIYDENNVVLFSIFRAPFDAFCEEHQLGYNYDTVPEEKLMNTGVNMFVSEKNENYVKIIFNIYNGGNIGFPKSKKLKVKMSKIKISKEERTWGEEEITLTGDWNFEVDVPEKMYNRKTFLYQQISTTNPDFNVLQATVYETGTDIKLKFQAEKQPKQPTTPEIEFWKSLPSEDELKSVDILNYLEVPLRYTPEYQEYMEKSGEVWEYEKYLMNEKGEKFEMTQGPRENGGGSIDDDGIYESYCTFDLTRYDATEKITVYVDYHGNKAEIILERMEEK